MAQQHGNIYTGRKQDMPTYLTPHHMYFAHDEELLYGFKPDKTPFIISDNKIRVIQIDETLLSTVDKTGIVSYLNTQGFIKGSIETLIIETLKEGVSSYKFLVTEIQKGEYGTEAGNPIDETNLLGMDTVTIIDENQNANKHLISTVAGQPVYETVTQFLDPQLLGTNFNLTYINELGEEQTITGDLSGLADTLHTVTSKGNVTSNSITINGLTANGTISANKGIYTIENNLIRVSHPKGGSKGFTGAEEIGAIKISLPLKGSNSMVKFEVDIHDDRVDKSIKILVGGYAVGPWERTYAQILGSDEERDLPVRFGNDGVSDCIWIGEVNTTWSHPKVSVNNFIGGHTNINSAWASGWGVSMVTTFNTVDVTQTDSFLWGDFNKLKNIPDFYTIDQVYTKTESNDRFVNITGDTMTGALAIIAPDNTFPFDIQSATETGYKLRTRYIDTIPSQIVFNYGLYHGVNQNTGINFYRGNTYLGGYLGFTTNNGTERLRIDNVGNSTFFGKIIKDGGTSNQFLKADGSVDESNYLSDVSVIDENTNISRNKIATIQGTPIYETVGEILQPELVGNVLYIKYKDGDGLVQQKQIDLSGLVTNDSSISNATYDASTNIITLEESDGSLHTIDLGEFSMIVSIDANGVASVYQEKDTNGDPILKLTVSRVGRTGEWAHILNPPTTIAGYGITDVYTKTEADDRFVNVTGDTMSGDLIIDKLGGHTLTLSSNDIIFNRDTISYIRQDGIGGELHFSTSNTANRDTLALRIQPNGYALFSNTVEANSFIKTGGTSDQFLMADGSTLENTFISSYTETDTLESVTSRGNITTNDITINALTTNGTITAINGLHNVQNDVGRVIYPEGATFSSESNTATGAIKIALPVVDSNTMIRFTVEVYEYYNDEAFTLHVGGQNNSTTGWLNTFAQIIGGTEDRDFDVRFGTDGVKDCIWVGELSSIWNYPKISITNVQVGYAHVNDDWSSGWEISLVSNFDTIEVLKQDNFLWGDFNKLKNIPELLTQTESDDRYVNITGDTMTGDLTMGNGSSLIVGPNQYVFKYSNDQDIGIYFNANTGQIETKNPLGQTIVGLDVGNGYSWFNGEIQADTFKKHGGTSNQFLKADGSVDTNTYLTGISWGDISGTLSNQTDLQNALNGKEPIFTKNTAFNKNFGYSTNDVLRGTDIKLEFIQAPQGTSLNNGNWLLNYTSERPKLLSNYYTGLQSISIDSTFSNTQYFYFRETRGSEIELVNTASDEFYFVDGKSNIVKGKGTILVTQAASYNGVKRWYVEGDLVENDIASTITQTDIDNWNDDIDTTYTAGAGLNLTGTEFSFDTIFGDNRYVNITGDTMTGDLNITGNISVTGNSTANSFIKTGGTSSQFLKADGSVDSTSYLPLSGGSMTGPIHNTYYRWLGDDGGDTYINSYFDEVTDRLRFHPTVGGAISNQPFNIQVYDNGVYETVYHTGNLPDFYTQDVLYTKTESDDRFVNITGDTMTGDLTVNTSVTSPRFNVTNGHGDLGSTGTEGLLRLDNGSNWGFIAKGLTNSPQIGTYFGGSLNIVGFADNIGTVDHNLASFNFSTKTVTIDGDTKSDRFIVPGGSSDDFLKADGSLDNRDFLSAEDQDNIARVINIPIASLPADFTDNDVVDYLNTNGFTKLDIETLIVDIDGDFLTIDWSNVTGSPTTLSGYGITDAYTKTESDSRYVNVTGDTMTGSLNINASEIEIGATNLSGRIEFRRGLDGVVGSRIGYQALDSYTDFGVNMIGGGAQFGIYDDSVLLARFSKEGQTDAFTMSPGESVLSDKYKVRGSSNNEILLGGGDTKPLSDFALSTLDLQGVTDNGGTTTNAVTVGDFEATGLSKQAGIYSIENGVIRVANPKGGQNGFTGDFTGAIKITLPVLWSDTMLKFELSIFDHTDANDFIQILVGGYNYSGTSSWYRSEFTQTFASKENKDLPIRFGHDGTNACIWVGNLTNTWKYPKIVVSNFQGGHAGITSQWAENWNISLVTAFDTVQVTKTGNFPYADWNKLKGKPTDLMQGNVNDYLKRDGSLPMTGELKSDYILGNYSKYQYYTNKAGTGFQAIVNNEIKFSIDSSGNSTFYGNIIKSGSSDSYVLLGGGGTKPVSDLVQTTTDQNIEGTKTFTNWLEAASLRVGKDNVNPTIEFGSDADNRYLYRNNNDLVWRYDGTNNGVLYHSGNLQNLSDLNDDLGLDSKYVNISGDTMGGPLQIVDGGTNEAGSWPLYVSSDTNLGWKVADVNGVSKFELYTGYSNTNEMRLLNGVKVVGYNQDLTLESSSADININPNSGILNVTGIGYFNGLEVGKASGATRSISTHSEAGRLRLNGGTSDVDGARIDLLGNSYNVDGQSIDIVSTKTKITGTLNVNDVTTITKTDNPGGTVFDVQGSAGQLFSITDSLEGDLFGVNDISGLPILNVHSDDRVEVYGELNIKSGEFSGLTTTTVVATVDSTMYDATHFDYVIKREDASGMRSGSVMSVWDGTNAEYTDNSTADLGGTTDDVDLSVDIVGGEVRLNAIITAGTWTIKISKRTL